MKEEEFDLKKVMNETEERDKRLAKMEEDGTNEIVKYFDRIHDKLFDLNNILIAGYFSLVALNKQVSKE